MDKRLRVYHASLDATNTENYLRGEKTIKPNYAGLGGSDDRYPWMEKDLMSFTVSKDVANNIARDLKTKIKIARGDINLENAGRVLNKIDANPRSKQKPSLSWRRAMRDAKRGFPNHYKRLREGKGSEGDLYAIWAYEYLNERERSGGFKNPGFIEDEKLSNLSKHDPSMVGIVEAMVVVPERAVREVYRQLEKDYDDPEVGEIHGSGWEMGESNNREIKLSPKRVLSVRKMSGRRKR